MNVIIVDDIPKQRLIEKLSELPGIEAKSFYNLDLAYAYVRQHAFEIDLMFVDEVFSNTDEFSQLKSGVELGKKLSTRFPYIPAIMFTANAYNVETTKQAYEQAGFITFIQKTELNSGNIETYLADITAHPAFQQKMLIRKLLRKEQIIGLFKTLNTAQRNRLSAEGGISKSPFSFGATSMLLTKVFDGYVDIRGQSNDEIFKLIEEFLQQTSSETVFHGQWDDSSKFVRILLEDYESSEEYSSLKRYLDFMAVNYLLRLLDLTAENSYQGTRNMQLDAIDLSKISNDCKPGDKPRMKCFFDKMIARRIAISVKGKTFWPITFENLPFLFKYNQTGTFALADKNGQAFKLNPSYNAGEKPKHIFSTCLGLSYKSRLPVGYEARANEHTESVRIHEFITDRYHLLHEESEFLDFIASKIGEVKHFFNQFEVSFQLGAIPLLDFEDISKALRSYNTADREEFLEDLKQQLTLQPDIIPIFEYLLEIKVG